MDLIGKIINQQYQIIEHLGEGGMSIAFKAYDIQNQRFVVCKFMNEKVTSIYIEDLIRFKREIEIISKLNHPRIVKVFNTGEFETRPFLVMELLAGKNLSSLLNEGEICNEKEILIIIKQLTEALSYVHRNGVIHRDLKPSNIFIVKENESTNIKLLDFGVALVMELSAIHEEKMVVGTFGYMSPEATGILNKRIDERSDLYSLGVILYHLLTGQLPFTEKEINRLLHQQVAFIPPRPSKINKLVPTVLDEITMKLLSKDPDFRYQSAQGLLYDLERLEQGEREFTIGTKDQKIKITYQTRLVGRETELNKIKLLYNKAKTANGCLCLIAGEAGIGKSRLVEEIRSYVYEQNGLFIRGRCLNHVHKNPYQPFKDALDEYLRILENAKTRWADQETKRLRNRFGDMGDIVIQLNPRFKNIIGSTKKLVLLEPERENQRFLMVLSDFFCHLVEKDQVCVIFLDDLQWADESSLNLLFEIIHKIDSTNVLVLGTYRDNEVGAAHRLTKIKTESNEKRYALEEMKLSPFEFGGLNQLMTFILGETATGVLDDLSRYILKKSKGNPFLAINLIRELVENKVIIWKEYHWKIEWEKLNKTAISDNMLAVISKSIDNLTVEQTGLLCKAAVIGREFESELLYKLIPLSKDKIVKIIDEIIIMQLLEKSMERGRLLFAHDRIRDAFYHRLDTATREEIHLQIAGVLEETHQNDPQRTIFDLAYHYMAGGDPQKSLEYLLPAAVKAKTSYANEEAIKYYQIGIHLLEQSGDGRCAVLIKAKDDLSEVYLLTGKNDEAITISESILPLIEKPVDKARIYKKIGIAYFKKGNWNHSEANLVKALALLGEKVPTHKFTSFVSWVKELMIYELYVSPLSRFLRAPVHNRRQRKPAKDEDREIVQIYLTLNWMYALSHTGKLVSNVLRMLNLSEFRIGKSKELATSLSYYAVICMMIPLFRRAKRYHLKALRIRKELGDEWGVAQSLQFIGFYYSWTGNHTESIKYLKESQEKYQKIGDVWEQEMAFRGLGDGFRFISDFENALKHDEQQLEISRKIKDLYGICTAQSDLSWCYIENGDIEKAEKIIQDTLRLSQENEIWLPYSITLIRLGYLKLEIGRYNEAMIWLETAKEFNNRHRFMKELVIMIYPCLADAYLKNLQNQISQGKQFAKPQELKQIALLCREALIVTKAWINHYGAALRVTANYYAFIKKNHKAQHYFLKSIMLCKQMSRRYELAKGYYEYGNFLNSIKRLQDAQCNWKQAYEIFKEINAKIYIQRCAAALGMNQPSISPANLTNRDRLMIERRLSAVLTTGRFISSILDIDELLTKILDNTIELIGAERGVLLLYPEEGPKLLEIKLIRNIAPEIIQSTEFNVSRSIIVKVETKKNSLILADALADEAFKTKSSVVLQGIRSVICAPIMNRGEMLGIIYLDNNLLSGLFNEADLQVLDLIANQAGVSIENGRLYSKLKLYANEIVKSRDEIAKWNLSLEQRVRERTDELMTANLKLKEYASTIEELAVVQERNRIAGDVHDTLGHTLSLLITILQVSIISCQKDPGETRKKLQEALIIAKEGLIEVRRSVSGLTTHKLESNNLINALEELVAAFQVSGMKINLSVNDINLNLNLVYADVIYRICQEALTNSLKHGNATEVNIVLKAVDQNIKLFILDNGRGCKDINNPKGFGLQGMKQRVASLNGVIEFGSNGQHGFNIRVEIPVQEMQAKPLLYR